MKKRVLITGATGFVGSHILEQMMHEDRLEPVAACRDPSRLLAGFSGETRIGDLTNENYLATLLDDIDIVCHAAAWTSLWGQAENSKKLYLQPTVNLINAVANSNVKQFINTSTTSANPAQSADPLSPGQPRAFWPHLNNVIEIENQLKRAAGNDCKMTNLRLGIFTGDRYGLGLLPVLLPRIKTHLVPWVNRGRTHLPIINGHDIGRSFVCACLTEQQPDYDSFNIVGPSVPTVREVFEFIHREFHYPKPHFSVPFSLAYPFAWLMEKMDMLVPWEPLVTRSIIHLIEDTQLSNDKAERLLHYHPEVSWQQSVSQQIHLIKQRNQPAMRLVKQIS